MQVFLPYPSFKQTAKALDYRRLGKQRIECLQILQANLGRKVVQYNSGYQLEESGRGWVNHPISKLWKPYPRMLLAYAYEMCDEWIRRGYKDTTKPKLGFLSYHLPWDEDPVPPFMDNAEFHDAYKAILLRKDPNHYLKVFSLADATEGELLQILSTPDTAITRWLR